MRESPLNGSIDQFKASVKIDSFSSTDPCAHEEATAPWENNLTPLDRGSYRQDVTSLASPRLILYRETTRSRLRVQGLSPPDMLIFAVPLVIGSDSRWWGKAHHEQGIPVMMPGGVHAEFSAGQQNLIALVDLKLCREYLPEDLGDAIVMAARHHVLRGSQGSTSQLGTKLNAVLDEVHANSQALEYAAVVDSIERDILTALRQQVELSPPTPKKAGRSLRLRGLQNALDYIRTAGNYPVAVSELCVEANVSQRTLEYAFHETFGISPLRFLQLRQFHTARRDLLAADGETITVSEIAYTNGFYQVGRFAVRYKNLFHESPSQTLMRPPMQIQNRLGQL